MAKEDDPGYGGLIGPAVLLFADDPARRAAIAEAVERAGGRVVANEALAGAVVRLDRQVVAGGVIVEVAEDGGAALDTLLAHLDAAAATMRFPSIVIIPHALIDIAVARLADDRARVLVAPDEHDLDAALAEMLAPRAPSFHDNAGDKRKLAQLSEEAGRLAHALAALSAGGEAVRDAGESRLPGGAGESAEDSRMVREILRRRRLRDRHFERALFADPAWDILLDLTAARHEKRSVAVSSLCIAAAVPATTALRWIATMTDHDLLARYPDPDDGRRVFITLTERAAGAMAGYLRAARRVGERA